MLGLACQRSGLLSSAALGVVDDGGEGLGLWYTGLIPELGFKAKFNQSHKDPQFHI